MNFGFRGVFNMKKNLYRIFISLLLVIGISCSIVACSQPNETAKTVKLNKTEISLDLYESAQLKATVEGFTEYVVEWSSSDTNVLTVENGKIFSIGEGVAVVTATVGETSASCEVTVASSGAVPLLSLTNNSYTIETGNQISIGYTVKYKNKDISANVSFSSSNSAVLTVDQSGTVSGVSAGTAIVTITANYFGFEGVKTVNITVV